MGRFGEGHHVYVRHKKNSIDSVEHKEFSQVYRTFLIIYALILSFLTSGVIFGWPALLLVLHNEGVYYGTDCPGYEVPNSNSTEVDSSFFPRERFLCSSQVEMLNLVFVVALAGYFITFFFTNFFLRRFGPRTTCGIGALLFLVGTIIFAFSSYHDSDHSDFDGFVPGYLLMAIGGPFIVTSFVHLSNLFPHSKSLVITCFNISVDASALCFLFFEILFSYYSCSRRLFFILYSIVPAVILLTLWIWPTRPFTASVLLSPTLPSPSSPPSQSSSSNTTDQSSEDDENAPIAQSGDNIPTPIPNSVVDRAELSASAHHTSLVHQRDKPLSNFLSSKPAHSQLSSASSLFLIIFASLFLLRLHYYLSTAYYQLLETTDFDYVPTQNFVRLFIVVMVIVGIIIIPFTQFLLSRVGITFTLFLMVIVSLLCNGIWLVNHKSSLLWVQIFGFILFGVWRGMMMRGMSWYVGVVYGGKGFGRMWGVVMGCVGVVSFGVWGMVRAVEDGWGEGRKGWFWMNVISLAVGAAVGLFFLAWCEYKISRSRRKSLSLPRNRRSNRESVGQ
eukprot:TRINITY_DN2889_c0_g1_i1.p1 TRINITY_DN2889_c0_g1~~TRINITY_DN2889_c0_g1_i1.p1  ORF type:complete len:559 (-),score=131.06 TRINITY_DN2889_c0_g1_i1:65-1741(-)